MAATKKDSLSEAKHMSASAHVGVVADRGANQPISEVKA
jgi:hypothetical protein